MATRPVRDDQNYWQEWMGILIALTQDGDSLKALAERIGMDPSKLGRIVRGEQPPKGRDLYRIAAGQNRSPRWYSLGPDRDPEVDRVMVLYRNRSKALFNQPIPLAEVA